MQYKTLRQKGETLKEAKRKLEENKKFYIMCGWKCDGDLSIKWVRNHYTGQTIFEVSQKMFK